MGGSDNGEIYIDCQPVGLTKESTYILTDTRNFSFINNTRLVRESHSKVIIMFFSIYYTF